MFENYFKNNNENNSHVEKQKDIVETTNVPAFIFKQLNYVHLEKVTKYFKLNQVNSNAEIVKMLQIERNKIAMSNVSNEYGLSFFPYFKGDKLVIEGITKSSGGRWDFMTRTGDFVIHFPEGEIINEKDVSLAYGIIFTDSLKMNFGGPIPSSVIFDKDLYNVIFIILKCKGYFKVNSHEIWFYDMKIYYGNRLCIELNSVSSEFRFITPNKFTFTELDEGPNGIFKHAIYEENHISIVYSGRCEAFGGALNECMKKNEMEEMQNTQNMLFDDKYVYVYFFVDGSKASLVLYEFCKCADEIIKLKNLDELDPSNNYLAKFKKSRVNDLEFVYYCLYKTNFMNGEYIGGYSVYGYPLDKYRNAVINDKYPILSPNILLSKEENDINLGLLIELYEISNEPFSNKDLPKKLRKYPTNQQILNALHQFFNEIPFLQQNEFKTEYQKLYDQAVDNGNAVVRWKAEYKLYTALSKIFKDAIYQFHDRWLGMQSIDIYIPSIKAGFEYQGIQHYKAIPLFGGEEGLEKRKKLDAYKRKKCESNGIKLIEWNYSLPITEKNIRNKLAML